MPAMVTPARWDGAALVPTTVDGARRAEVAQLAPGLPSVTQLFDFMRDAELRFASLRLRLVERSWVARGEVVRTHELLLRHPGRARVTITGDDAAGADIWLSDGSMIRTLQTIHRTVTTRPVRSRLVGLEEDRDLPGTGRAYLPVTSVRANSLVDTFVHPAGFCQNVLATGTCRVLREEMAVGRTAIILESLHPRTIELAGDRGDHRVVIAADRETGLLTGLAEYFTDQPTRVVVATELAPDAAIPDAAFTLHAPDDAASIY